MEQYTTFVAAVAIIVLVGFVVHLAHKRTVELEDAEVRFLGLVVRAKRFKARKDS